MKYLISILIFFFSLTLGAFERTPAYPAYNEFRQNLSKTVNVSVKATGYEHFSQVIWSNLLKPYTQNYKGLSILTKFDHTEVILYRTVDSKPNSDDVSKNDIFKVPQESRRDRSNPDSASKDDVLVVFMYARKNESGYDIYIKLETETKSKKLAKDIEKAFKKKRKI
jgi:hypothetical protein